jgi:hypothetical protein
MDRFFFHFVSKDRFIRDEQGRRFDDLAAAHRHATELMHKAILHLPNQVDWDGWSIKVTNSSDRMLLCVLFSSILCRAL